MLYNHIDGQRIGMTYLYAAEDSTMTFQKVPVRGYSTGSHDALARTAKRSGYQEEFLVKPVCAYRKDDSSLCDRFWGCHFPRTYLVGKSGSFGGRVLSATKNNTDEVCQLSGIGDISTKAGNSMAFILPSRPLYARIFAFG